MKTLIIGDRHNAVDHIEATIAKHPDADSVVFTGDFFDNFHDTPAIAENTARWLKHSLQQSNRIHCIGNHDLPYIPGVRLEEYNCPGFDVDKQKAINDILTPTDWAQLVGATVSQDILISHAGFTMQLFQYETGKTTLPTAAVLADKANNELKKVMAGGISKYYQPGDRMGYLRPGGIIWADWNDEFINIPGINQVVGHTPSFKIRANKNNGAVSYCVDCAKQYVMLENGALTIYQF